ncbi:hypothetical protein CAPTEDRAFT_75004, partial [Capitella teleta]
SWTDFLLLNAPLALHVDRSITPIWYAVGIAGNLISARIWMTRRIRQNNSSAVYLATLSITDMLLLVLHILQELRYAWGIKTLAFPFVCETYFVFYLSAQYLSPFLVLGFTVERYIAVCHPFKKEEFCTTSRATRVVVGLVLISISLCFIQAYFWRYDSAVGDCIVRSTTHDDQDGSLWSIWTWSTEMLVFMAIPLVILLFNIMVIREVRKMSNFESAMT